MEQTSKTQTQLRRVGRPPKAATYLTDEPQPIPVDESFAAACNAAQAYAMRIWEGQSPDVPRAERVRRVAAGLEGQNMSVGGVELPESV